METIQIGQVLSNDDITAIFKCGNMGGMRRSRTTNTLVLIADHTKDLYDDKWIGDTLHYTGMGKKGNQSLNYMQNRTLAESKTNGIEVHLFEVETSTKYIYRGQVELSGNPYEAQQGDEDDKSRAVWVFPIKLKLA